MYCTNCKREIPDSIKFCPHCGQPVQIKNRKDATNAYYNTGIKQYNYNELSDLNGSKEKTNSKTHSGMQIKSSIQDKDLLNAKSSYTNGNVNIYGIDSNNIDNTNNNAINNATSQNNNAINNKASQNNYAINNKASQNNTAINNKASQNNTAIKKKFGKNNKARNNNQIAPKEGSKKRKALVLTSIVLVLMIVLLIAGYKYYKSVTIGEDTDLVIEYINGITYCSEGVIYVDTDITDKTAPLILVTEDEALIEKCFFSNLSDFNLDNTITYYVSDLKEKKTRVCGSLYKIYTKDITNNTEENKKNSTLIANDVYEFRATSGTDNAIIYENVDNEIFSYSDNGTDYLMDGEGLSLFLSYRNYDTTHFILTRSGTGNEVNLYFDYILGSVYDLYQYDSKTHKLRLINEDIANIPVGDENKLVYITGQNYMTEGGDLYISEISDEKIDNQKVDKEVTFIESSTITDDITHITYTKEGLHTEDTTEMLYSYNDGDIIEYGEVNYKISSSEYVTFYDLFDENEDSQDAAEYYSTGTSEVYTSPFNRVIDVQMALNTDKLLVQALDDDYVSCLYICDVEYGKEIINIQKLAHNATVAGEYGQKYLFYVSGEKVRNLYIADEKDMWLRIRGLPQDDVVTVSITPNITEDSTPYYFLIDALDYNYVSTIYDVYFVDEDQLLDRVETMVEQVSVNEKGLIYKKDKALYFFNAETRERTKIADSFYYYVIGNKYNTDVSISTFILEH